MRAADRDRDAVNELLTAAYADGRLDRQEYDDRCAELARTRTLGELPVLVTDLLPATSQLVPWPTPPSANEEIRARAIEQQRRDERQALWAMISASVITFTIWVAINWDPSQGGFQLGFPWPLFVLLGTGINYGHKIFDRQDSIEERVQRLERRAERRKSLPPSIET